ncbi:MAG: hypothetical protein AB7O37_06410 [Vicinamibacteria bacterium]
MDRRSLLALVASAAAARKALGELLTAPPVAPPSPAAAPAEGRCFQPGDALPGDAQLFDARLEPVALASLVPRGTRVVYLVLFGGAHGTRDGDVWCGDSERELPLHRAVLRRFAGRGVLGLGVAVPPAYSARHGYPEGAFRAAPGSEAFREAAARFVARTEALRAQGALPFDVVAYDPGFRLLDNPKAGPREAAQPASGWQGRFKACGDRQRHGTPTLWLADGALRVSREPFFGNLHDQDEPVLRYGETELTEAVERALAARGTGH